MDRHRFRKVLRRVIVVPLAIAAVLAVLLIVAVQSLVRGERWVEHTDEVIQAGQALYRAQVDQETGLRAYLLTKDDRFLEPFYDGRSHAARLEARLRQLVADNPEQQARVEKAFQACEEWALFAEETLAKAKAGQDVTDVNTQLREKELMDRARAARSEFTHHEAQLRAERLARSRRTLRIAYIALAALCFLVGGLLAALGRKQLLSLSKAFNSALDTAQANANEARAQEEWLQTTLCSIGDAVIATDAAGAVTFMNGVAEALTGWTPAEAKRKPLAEVFRIVNEQSRETVENPVEKVRRLGRVVGLANHTILIGKTGKECAIDDSGAPIRDAQGAIIGVVLVFRDVTQQRRLEAALQSNERLAVAGRLSAAIAHEIHNPLDTVGNLLFLVGQHTAEQPEVQQLIGKAQGEVARVAEISRNMLSLQRESRSAVPVRLADLLEGVVALIEETIAKGRRKIQLGHGFEGEIQGFPSELRQVFTNVIKNAVEATADGGNIRVFSVPIEETSRNGVMVYVFDNGVGIPEEMQSRLFSPFASSKDENGSGLGLWVSRSILEKHGGTIQVSSRAETGNPGTTVAIFLPLEPAPTAANNDSMAVAS